MTLLAINAKYVHSSLAVWYLAAAVTRFSTQKHEVSIIEATINQPEDHILEQIVEAVPSVLGISVYIWNAAKVEALVKQIKVHLPETRVVLGGPEASYNAQHWLSQGADFVLQGEGEGSFPRLLDALKTGDEAALGSIPGLWRQAEGGVASNPVAPAGDFTINPYSDIYWRTLGGRIAYVETSRGCPFRCAFCLSGGSKLRFFPIEEAKEQLLRLSKSGSKTIKLVDRTFNCNTGRAYELFEYIMGLDTDCCFHFEVAPDLFDETTLDLLHTAPRGRIQLEAGLQSFYQPTLDAVARKTNLEAAEKNLKSLLMAGNIHIHVDLIAGLPHETLPLFKGSFNRAYGVGAHMLQVGFLKLLHGSALRAQAASLGLVYSSDPPYEIISSPWLSEADLDTIRLTEHALQRVYNSGRFTGTAAYGLAACGLTPFEFYHTLGRAASGYNIPLGQYAKQVYDCLGALPGVDEKKLCDHMICDWLCAMGGKNMPDFLKIKGAKTWNISSRAQEILGRKIARCESAILHGGDGVFIDSDDLDPVTGRYKLHRI